MIITSFYRAAAAVKSLLKNTSWILLILAALMAGCDNDDDDDPVFVPEEVVVSEPEADPNLIVLEAGDDLETRAQKALIEAVPGNIIELPAGTFDFKGELSVSVNNVTLRGKGMEETVLNYANQESGGQGILATGDAFTVEDLTVMETRH